MKRLFSIILSLFLIVSLSLPAFATDSGSDSGTGSMAAGGIDQNLTGLTETIVEAGYSVYGSTLLKTVPSSYFSKYDYWVLVSDDSDESCFYLWGSTKPFTVSEMVYDSEMDFFSPGPVHHYTTATNYTIYNYGLKISGSGSWSFNTFKYTAYNSFLPFSFDDILWANSDIVYLYNELYNTHPELDGTVCFSGSDPISSGSSIVGEGTHTFESSSFNNFSFSDGVALYAGTQVGQSFSGDLTYSGSFSSPYVDINLPLSAWTDTVPELYDRVSIDGSLLFDFAAGLTLWCTEGEGQFKHIISDLVPSSFQILINGEECADTTQYPFDSSLRANIGHVFSEYQHLEVVEKASVTTDKIAVDSIDTLGFRIYLSSASGSTSAQFTNDLTFAMLWPYVYANFAKFDGSLGLPALTFYEVEPEPDPSPEPSEDPDPEVTEDPDPEVTEDPDPEPSEDPDPEPSFEPSPDPDITVPSEMELLGSLLSKTVSIFQFKFTIFGYGMSFWGILLFLILAGIVIALIRRFTQ